MNKLTYLKKTVETYVVVDPNTRGEFKITVTEGMGDIHFEMEHSRVMSAEGVGASIELLKQLLQNDCFNPVGREGETEGKKKFKPKKNITTNIAYSPLDAFAQFKAGDLSQYKQPFQHLNFDKLQPKDKGEAA